jgi:flagellar export protein FliJ
MHVSGSRLQTVIKVKQFQVKATQRELAVIKVHKEQEQSHLTQLEETQSTAMSDAVREMKSRAADLQTSRAFIESLSRKIRTQEQKVEEIKSREDAKRGELVEKSQSEQMLEKLEEKRKTEVEKDVERKAQRMIDVLAQRVRMGF